MAEQPTTPRIKTSRDKVRRAQFTSRRFLTKPWRKGYDEIEVDDLLDDVEETLEFYEDKQFLIGGEKKNNL
jgi:DivIVA domain-containing protein